MRQLFKMGSKMKEKSTNFHSKEKSVETDE